MLLSVRQQATAQADFCSAGADEHALALLRVFLKLGLTSFGGSVAHIGYFRDEFVGAQVARRHRLCRLGGALPGPASSQVGLVIGLSRAGYAGALAAWVGFSLPSACAMVLFAHGVGALGDATGGATARP
jgi:chromate transporter